MTVVTCCVYQDAKGSMPHATCNFEVAKEKELVISRLSVDVSQDDTNHGQSILTLTSVVNGASRDEGFSIAAGVPKHEVLKA